VVPLDRRRGIPTADAKLLTDERRRRTFSGAASSTENAKKTTLRFNEKGVLRRLALKRAVGAKLLKRATTEGE
jgi:hypothetical protein